MGSRKGQVLVEALVAITLVTVGLLGIFTLISRSLHLHRDVTMKATAVYLAAEGIEIVRHILDTNIAQGIPWNSKIAPGASEVSYEVDYACFDPSLGAAGCAQIGGESTTPLTFDSATGIYYYGDIMNTPFMRTVGVTQELENAIQKLGDAIFVSSRVRWVRDGEEESVYLTHRFYNWRKRPET